MNIEKGKRKLLGRWIAVSGLIVVLGTALGVGLSVTARARAPVAKPTPTVEPTPVETPRPVGVPTIELANKDVHQGHQVRLLGVGWPAASTIVIELVPISSREGAPQTVATVSTTGAGRFELQFTFPSDWQWNGTRGALLSALCLETGQEVTAVLRLHGADTPPEPTATPAEAIATPTSTPVATSSAAGCSDRASFVADVTIPDNAMVVPGQSFVKTWRLLNSGTCTWTPDYALVFAGGHRLGAVASIPLGTRVAPGSSVDLSVTLTAPSESGVFEGRWQLRNAEGRLFGTGANSDGVVWVRITVGPASVPTPTISGWHGEYFGNRDLAGSPTYTRDDATIAFDWGTGSPIGALSADGFSARWTRTLSFEAGTYRFHVLGDDGVRVWVDGQLIIDEWHAAAGSTYASDRTLTLGTHALRVEYYEQTGAARIQFWWEKVTSFPDWRGEYWSNRSLGGSPVLVRNDTKVDFNWKLAAPAAGLPSDGFSARWTRQVTFDAATYRFRVTADDGSRLWVDDQLIIDSWRDGSSRELTAEHALVAGKHQVRLEFYENLGEARICLSWEKLSSTTYPNWKGEYWANRKLAGSPTLVRNDRTIDFAWGAGSAAAGLPEDNFSARWTRKLDFDAGVYLFQGRADDGIRVYLDDRLIIDEWQDGTGDLTYKAEVPVTGGRHELRIEYYDRTGQALIKVSWKWLSGLPTPTPEPNRRPVAVDDSATTNQGTQVSLDVLANDTDADGDVLAVTAFSATSTQGGTVSCTGAGWCTYTPLPAFVGSDRFTYVVSDGRGGTRTGTVSVKVNEVAVNRQPVATDDEATTNQDVPVTINVLTNDTDPDGDALKVIDYDRSSTHGGNVECAKSGDCKYDPAKGFSGSDSFGYTVRDGKGDTDSASVLVTVRQLPANAPPVAADDSATTQQGTSVTINVLQNDSDPDKDELVVSAFDARTLKGGRVECTAAGACVYAPRARFSGSDRFGYTVSDGKGGTDAGIVTVTVERSASIAPGVLINEILPVPVPEDAAGEWIELYNGEAVAVDIGGWYLDDGEEGSAPYRIPEGTTIQSGGFLLFSEATTGIALDDTGDEVRFVQPDGMLADSVVFEALQEGASYSRDAAGDWHADWQPSPGAPNSSLVAVTSGSR